MSNLATVTPIKPHLEVVEHRVADTEDGFMRVANELTDSLLMADLTARQLKVMLAIMRKTYGFNKPMDRLTNTQIAAMTGIHHTHICAAKRQLIERKFLIADGVRIGVNKVVSQWISQDSLTLAKTANKTLAKSANGYKPTQLNTKDTIQKKEIQDKNIMSESVRTKCEKSSGRHEETDKAFEEIFWCAGMRKAGKKNAASAFRTQFREWRKITRGTASEFATMLAEDIACRNGKQFGFDRLLPSSYLNGQRWNDEKPETIQPQSKPSSAITVSKTGYVFFDR
ncbi:replication protein [Salmonella enterica subsp. enterica]|nr:replication protein [Salmonella enterica subsp. enterica serovar Grumpensis]EEP9047518.1 replication protein [Salmonella enterica subsp. enterica serovar Grumpensis]EEP9786264.1 replication protein [Salmonella enterica subsp. enterica serovar Grumpensis]